MRLTDFAIAYCRRRRIRSVPVYSAHRFAALVGDLDAETVTQDIVDRYVAAAADAGTPAWTIRGTVNNVRTLVRASGGPQIAITVRAPQPDPRPCAISDLDLVWPHLAPWSRQWLVLAYWTCLRLEDSIRLQLALDRQGVALLTWTAHKTGWTHRYPIAEWLRPHIAVRSLPYGRNLTWSGAIVRAELERCSTKRTPADRSGLSQMLRPDWP